MHTRPHQLRRARPAFFPLATLCAASLLMLQACGGSDGDDTAPPPSGPVAFTGVVADGPLQGASVCYDLNNDGACNVGEPEDKTDADGTYSFDVDAAAAGKHAVLAFVPADAIDKDTGTAVGTAFLLKSPPTGSAGAQKVFVSPLTTVVADLAASSGSTVAEAAAQVQSQLGLTVSPLADFTAAGAPAAAAVARRAVGKVMIDTAALAAGAQLGTAQATQLVSAAAVSQLPVLAAALELGAGGSATPKARIDAAAAAVAKQLNLSAETVNVLASVLAPQVADPSVADAAGPFVSVRRFAYTDANNYSYQIFVGDSSQTDANGAWVAHEPRANVVNGEAIAFSRNQLYWTGSDWNNCDNGHAVVTTTAATAKAPQKSSYCGASRSESRPVWEDISGKTLREVITRMRAYKLRDNPGSTTDATGLPVNWGPAPALLPAEATFPAGSRYNQRAIRNDIGHVDRIETAVRPTVRYADGVFRQATTLEQLALMGGNLADAAVVPTNLNALFVEDAPLASQADAALQPIKRWRLAVDVAGLKGRFYRCDVVLATGASQGCQATGDAALAVQVQGGIRLLRVASGYPAELKEQFKRQRFWAEHMGTVFRGSTDLERTHFDQRLNKPAWDALRTALGLAEPVVPAAPAAAGPFRLLRNFSYTDAQNYSWRLYTGDESMLDANGRFVVNESRRQLSGGVEQPFARNRTYWTGTSWYDCPDSGPVITAQAAAPFRSVLCQGHADEQVGMLRISLGGRLMSDVVNEIRSYASTDAGGVGWGGWGTASGRVAALATTRFPAGSTLTIRGGRPVAVPEAIGTAESDRVRVPLANAGFTDWPMARTLEELVAGYPGSLLGATANGGNTLVFRILDETPTDPLHSRTVDYRVAFDPVGNKARFTRNNRLASNGNSTNDSLLLDTTYTVEQLGGVRLMKFSALPADFESRFGYAFRLAERGGQVWYAFRDQAPADKLNWQQRLDGTAWDALRTVLGIQ